MWITLALQKQKGFREQQQNREDRRSLREAKLAEKQSRDRESVIILNDLSDSPTWLLHVFRGTPSRPVPSRNKPPSLLAGHTTEPHEQ